MAHVVQQTVIDGFTDISHRPLRVGGGDDLVGPGCIFVGSEDADLSSGNFLFVDVHCLENTHGQLV